MSARYEERYSHVGGWGITGSIPRLGREGVGYTPGHFGRAGLQRIIYPRPVETRFHHETTGPKKYQGLRGEGRGRVRRDRKDPWRTVNGDAIAAGESARATSQGGLPCVERRKD